MIINKYIAINILSVNEPCFLRRALLLTGEKCMKAALIISIIINMGLIIKLIVMRLSLKELSEDYRERVTLDSDTLIGVSSRDKYIRELASAINDTITEMRGAFHAFATMGTRTPETERILIENISFIEEHLHK